MIKIVTNYNPSQEKEMQADLQVLVEKGGKEATEKLAKIARKCTPEELKNLLQLADSF